MTRKLSGPDSNAVYRLAKHGELLLGPDGYFGVPEKPWGIERARVERLARLGYCRIDVVGESTFAVSLRAA